MDLVANAIQAKQADLQSQIQFAVARKVLDNAEVQGKAVVQLIQAAANAGKAEGMGENFDATG